MPVPGAIIVPHPPVILPTVGKGRETEIQATADACRQAAQAAAGWKPDVLIVASPHAAVYADYFHISPGSAAAGDMESFGAPQTRLEVKYDIAFRRALIQLAETEGLPAGTLGERDAALDHGTLVPLWFLREAGVDCPIVRIGLSGLPPLAHYRLGQCIAKAADILGRRAVVIASGDLSHKLKADGPYGFAPEGPEFDREVTKAMADGDFLRLLTMDPLFCNRAAECGLRSFQIMAGALDGLAVESRLLSYQDSFGVGYGVALLHVKGPDADRCFAAQYQAAEARRLSEQKAKEDPWVRLARLALETYVRTGNPLAEPPAGLPEALTERAAGAFVSLHVHGELRGCIGTTAPTARSVAWEIMGNAVSAGTRDPRFPPVREEELDALEYSVDVLEAPEPIESPDQLDVKRYGVIVSCENRRGLLLPDLDGVDTVEQQIEIARLKGGISANEPYRLERFEVVRHR